MKRRTITVLLTAAVLCVCMTVPVSAAEDSSAWIELLEYASVNNYGHNQFKYQTSATITIDTPAQMRLYNLDILFTFSSTLPTEVALLYDGTSYPLTIVKINSTTARAYGDIPAILYNSLSIRFTRKETTNSYVEVLSCRASQIKETSVLADADVYFSGYSEDGYFSTGEIVRDPGTSNHAARDYQARIAVYDWSKFDSITIWGSVRNASISSIRATIGTVGLPIEMSYLDSESDGGWIHAVTTDYTSTNTESTDATITSWYGNFLYCVTIDLTEIDRTALTDPLYLYLSGSFDEFVGMEFNCQYVRGGIFVADTQNVTWWNKFTSFMTGLFSPNSNEADEFSSEMESQGAAMNDMVGQMDTVQKPDVEDVNVDASAYVDSEAMATTGQIMNEFMANEMVLTMLLIAASVGLGAFIVF